MRHAGGGSRRSDCKINIFFVHGKENGDKSSDEMKTPADEPHKVCGDVVSDTSRNRSAFAARSQCLGGIIAVPSQSDRNAITKPL